MTEMMCCPLGYSDDEGPAFTFEAIVKARKPHGCCECRDVIPPGAKYERVSGKWDDSLTTHKTCLSCAEIRKHFGCGGWVYEQLWDDLRENFFPTMKAGGPCMKGLSPEAKARLFELRLQWCEDNDHE